jgi:hypothetical protein
MHKTRQERTENKAKKIEHGNEKKKRVEKKNVLQRNIIIKIIE